MHTCVLVLVLLTSLIQIRADDNCITPNNETASCKPLYKCPQLLEVLITQKKEAIDFVRESHCGSWSSETQPFVCCGTKSSRTAANDSYDQVTVRASPTRQKISDKRFCGFQHTDDYFYAGNVTAIDEFPWLGVFKYKRDSDLEQNDDEDFYEFGCAGSLINNRYVLTAAQCLRLATSTVVAVRFGEYNIKHDVDCVKFSDIDDCSNPVEDVGIERKIKHPNYNRRTGVNDIALLRLNRSVSYSDYIRPICLPDAETRYARIGEIMTLTGFGRVATDKNYAIIKKRITSRLISNEQCRTEFSDIKDRNRYVTDNIMCTKELADNKDRSCEGDSGGPLMFSHRTQWHIEGIAVWSTAECSIDYPFAYTRVANYIDWIERTVVS
ncbi:phenoloxidase-activating factor 1-like isoform X1 [Photinus pyralis]|uniref:phenoloxidase-activating factor 1-like n=1 Tax=Photinus pyralis TaxID=7054 RepID=UPI0012677E4D|nr:phenoloxidase-activating factor 1-like [Photinus pyralis]XP_031346606.1 phenoloxidase-activating factor 1-like isoform X1 [Photinus pyralis]